MGWYYTLTVVGALLSGIGTVLVAAIAIWGDQIKAWLWPPNLALEIPDGPPDPISFRPPRFYLHIRVRNRGRSIARNCRVMLRGMERRHAEERTSPQCVPFALQFTWSPSEMPPLQRNIGGGPGETFDLGFVEKAGEEASRFCPQFYVTPAGHDYTVAGGVLARYFLDIDADNYVSPMYLVEVVWDGHWDDEPEKMHSHLNVARISQVPARTVE